MDYFVHQPDLPLYANGRLFGLGLWTHRWLTMGVEFGLFAVGIWIYQTRTKPKDKIGLYGFVAFGAFLFLAYAGASFGPPPPSVKKLAAVTLLAWLMIPWAWWFDKHRSGSPAGAGG